MRILWIHQYFATPRGWGAVRTYEFARRFCSAGHTVDVLCCAGYDASLTEAGGGPAEVAGMRVHVSGAGYRPHMGFLRRVLSFLRFMAYALWHVLRKGGGYDVVIASSGPLTLAVPALMGRWLRRLPFVFEVIDVWPDSAIAAGVLKSPVLKWLSFKVEALAYRYAAGIVTCSTGMTERVLGKIGSRQSAIGTGENAHRGTGKTDLSARVVTISNCCDLEQFAADGEGRRRTRERLGVRDGQTVALYTGAMGLSNAVGDLVAAVRGTRDDGRIVWWFAGDGGKSSSVREEVGDRRSAIGDRQSAIGNGESTHGGAERTEGCGEGGHRFFGSLAKEQVVELYLAADVNVVTFMHEPLFYENSPNKFFDGIAAGLPAVFNRTTWLEPWLERYGCGIVCTSDDAGAEMACQLKRLAADGELRRRMGQGARRLAEEVFSRDQLAAEYLEVLAQAVAVGSSGRQWR